MVFVELTRALTIKSWSTVIGRKNPHSKIPDADLLQVLTCASHKRVCIRALCTLYAHEMDGSQALSVLMDKRWCRHMSQRKQLYPRFLQVAQLAGLHPGITRGAQEAGKLLERKLQVGSAIYPHVLRAHNEERCQGWVSRKRESSRFRNALGVLPFIASHEGSEMLRMYALAAML